MLRKAIREKDSLHSATSNGGLPEAFSAEALLGAIGEAVAVKDIYGRYSYVNAAFLQMTGLAADAILGRDDSEVFGFVSAQDLAVADRKARLDGYSVSLDELHLPDGKRCFEVSRQLLGEEDRTDRPIVSVWREQSTYMKLLETRERAMGQTIAAFARSIRFADPYLGDHAQRLARLARGVGEALGCDENSLMTIEYAAVLSQVGKLALDKELLCKPGRLTREETLTLQRHVDDTVTLLGEFDFGLPVAQAVHQMHERLDGTGYPEGLAGDDIKLPGRILGACDVFCARISPRSYRRAIALEEALVILQQNGHRYDSKVVRALSEVVSSPAGRRRIAQP